MTDDMKPRGGTGTFDGLNFAAANFEVRTAASSTHAHHTAAANSTDTIKEEEESKERRAAKRGKRSGHTTSKHITPANTTNTRRPLTPTNTTHPHLRIDLFPSLPQPGLEGVSVSTVSKNGVSFFPHFSFNDEGKEGGEEEGEEVSGRMEGEGETDEKSRVSSTEMDDDISIRYTTPTMASNHIVRPLPSPSSLSVPQPSIGSGLGSSVEHSVVGSMPYKGRMGAGREGSAFFPPVFSPRNSTNGSTADIYGEDGIAPSPLSGHTSLAAASAASPPSTTSPLTHALSPLHVFPRPHDSAPQLPRHLSHPSMSLSAASSSSSSTSSLWNPTTTLVSPPPPPGDHLTLNTNAIALASQLFDDSDFGSHTSGTSQYSAAPRNKQQRSPRHAIQRVGSMPANLRAPGGGGGVTTASQSTGASPPAASPHSADNSAFSPVGMYRHTSQPSPTDSHNLSTHASSSQTSTGMSTPYQQPASTSHDDLFPNEPTQHSRAFTRPSLSVSSLHTPSYSISSLRTQGSGQRSPNPLHRASGGRVERGRMAGVEAAGGGRMSDGLYSVSRGSDVDEDGSSIVMSSGGGGVVGVEEEELSTSHVDSTRSREESRLKAVAAMKS